MWDLIIKTIYKWESNNPILIFGFSVRYTFATSVVLANGVSIENVAKMLGHSNTNMTRHYARVLDKSIKRDMDAVNKVFSNTTDSNTQSDTKVKTISQEKTRPLKSQPEIELVN